jgi:glycosyltransferase involved in cell wall biosynthesis
VSDPPRASIIVPTKNSKQELPRLLTSLKTQSMSDFEIIVVDGGSLDGTREHAIDSRCTVVDGTDMAQSKNLGASVARGEILIFLDADMEVLPNFVESCLDSIQRSPLLYFRETVVSESWWARARGFEKLCYFGSGVFEAPRCFRKEVFLTLGGYDERFVNSVEDMELEARVLERKLHGEWLHNPTIYHHEEGLGLQAYLAKRRGRPIEGLRRLHPEFWERFSSVRFRVSLLLKGLRSEPRPTNVILVGLVALQRLLEYRGRVGSSQSDEDG